MQAERLGSSEHRRVPILLIGAAVFAVSEEDVPVAGDDQPGSGEGMSRERSERTRCADPSAKIGPARAPSHMAYVETTVKAVSPATLTSAAVTVPCRLTTQSASPVIASMATAGRGSSSTRSDRRATAVRQSRSPPPRRRPRCRVRWHELEREPGLGSRASWSSATSTPRPSQVAEKSRSEGSSSRAESCSQNLQRPVGGLVEAELGVHLGMDASPMHR